MDYNLQKNQNAEQTYHSIRNSIVSAQHRLSTAVNSAMVTTYWEIGEQIFKACGENDRAEYGKKALYWAICSPGPVVIPRVLSGCTLIPYRKSAILSNI